MNIDKEYEEYEAKIKQIEHDFICRCSADENFKLCAYMNNRRN